MRKCLVYTTNDLKPILIRGYISHHIGKKWCIIRGSFSTHIIKTEIIYDISILEEL